MRQQTGIGQIYQGLLHVRFSGENIKTGGGDPPFRQRRDQRRLVNRRAAANIDQHPIRPKCVEDAGIDSLVGRGPTRHYHNQRINFCGHAGKRFVPGISDIGAFCSRVVVYADTESLQPSGNGKADAPQPENADSPTPQC